MTVRRPAREQGTASSDAAPRRLPPLLGLGAAIAIPCATLLLVLPLWQLIDSVRLIFFVPAVIAVGWLAGEVPGVLAALLAGAMANRFGLSPGRGFDTSLAGLVSTAFFSGLGSLLAIGASRLRARVAESRALAREVARSLELEQAARVAARAEEERFRTLVEALPQLVFTARPDGALDFHNRRILEYSGLKSEELAGVGWTRLLYPGDLAVASEGRRRILESGQPRAFEVRLRRRDGDYRWFLVTVEPLRGFDGGVVKWFGTCTDIQAQKEAVQAQGEAVHARDVFLSIASHELRTPLTAAQLQIQSAQRQYRREWPEGFSSSLAARLDSTAASVERLGVLVNALLDVSHVASGKLVTCRDPLDLSELVPRWAERLSDAARRGGSELGLDVERGVSIVGDELRLEQVLTNLLSNAIKYGEGRPIEVRLRCSSQRALLSVIDHGIGISPEDQVRIFDRFERAVNARHYSGLGLGLWIARQIVQASGAVLRVASAPGKGSTFTVDLPLEREAEAPMPAGQSLVGGGPH
jgi:PAS domain S-box-containing protein